MTSPSQSSPSHFSPSRIAAMAGSVDRSRSVSSIRSSILPPRFLAYSQLNSAVRAPPMWRKPVGEGAKRVTTESVMAGEAGRDFIGDIVQADLDSKKHTQIVTRFPPEPNGYLHIGHAKSIALNFGIAQEFSGRCHLRFDDTNPTKEEQEYIDSIQADVKWLGYDWGTDLFYASDYFERLYQWAEILIRNGHAYVDDQSQEQIRLTRGTLTEPGRNSPFRERPVEENLDLFRRMKAGEFPNGARVLRAKIDMSSGNINLRDPVL